MRFFSQKCISFYLEKSVLRVHATWLLSQLDKQRESLFPFKASQPLSSKYPFNLTLYVNKSLRIIKHQLHVPAECWEGKWVDAVLCLTNPVTLETPFLGHLEPSTAVFVGADLGSCAGSGLTAEGGCIPWGLAIAVAVCRMKSRSLSVLKEGKPWAQGLLVREVPGNLAVAQA